MAAKPKPQSWTMPKWMEPYRELIRNTGGNSVEELMNDQTDVRINLPRAILAVAVKSQVSLLCQLRSSGLLAKIIEPAPEVHRTVSG